MFSSLKIVELASVLAGPAVGLFFAELGATVIKVENATTGGDVTRNWRLPSEDKSAQSAYYSAVNWNKQTIFADLTQAADRAKILEIIRTADVVISNFSPQAAEKLGMRYEDLHAANPQLIVAELSAFGDGAERPAFDVVLQAEAGFLFMSGEPDRDPVKMPVALIDILAAHQLKEGILVALLHRERTGEGARVQVSLLEAAIASLANQATNWLMAGHIAQPLGALHPNIAPYGELFRTADGKLIVLAVGTERQFQQLCAAVEAAEILDNPAFVSNTERVRHRERLKIKLAEAIKKWNADELMQRLNDRKVPAGYVRNMQEVFEIDAAKNMILEETLPDGTLTRRVRTVAFSRKGYLGRG